MQLDSVSNEKESNNQSTIIWSVQYWAQMGAVILGYTVLLIHSASSYWIHCCWNKELLVSREAGLSVLTKKKKSKILLRKKKEKKYQKIKNKYDWKVNYNA